MIFLPLSKAAFQWPIFSQVSSAFALLPVVGTGRIDVARGLVSASVVSRVVAVNNSHIKEARRRHCIRSLERCRDICKATRRRNGTSVRIPPTIVHKCEPRATRSLAKPHKEQDLTRFAM
ncbi:hypothetical protein AVEN_150268-1 [Araneus ventricosus]|uniref:Uncharacterized protein n=1 Tax=Araneus ventricosus TaxID=182803 RepID=A0A4Y2HCZ3_ARAVE|nr:hypothetical protein AVEN_150268-1 [Araneus ventricosus]